MSKHREILESDLSIEELGRACRRAISDIGWRVLEDDGRRLVLKEVSPQVTNFTWAAKAELMLSEDPQGSIVEINGTISGLGPIQKGHLKGQIGALANKIALEAESAKGDQLSDAARHGLSAELEKLAELRNAGILSEDEFTNAKLRAIEGA